jgi:hypothetical protein
VFEEIDLPIGEVPTEPPVVEPPPEPEPEPEEPPIIVLPPPEIPMMSGWLTLDELQQMHDHFAGIAKLLADALKRARQEVRIAA